MPEISLELIKSETLDKRSTDLAYIKDLQVNQEKWNIGKNDILLFIKSKQVYFYLIKRTTEISATETIGSISVFNNGTFAVIGAFIIDTKFRGYGIGQYVLSTIITIHKITFGALLSEPKREAFYERNSFKIAGFFSNLHLNIKKTYALDMKLDKITANEIKKLLTFDMKHVGFNRVGLLKVIIEEPENTSYISFSDDHTMTGYGILRPLEKGYRISIYALSSKDFEEIFGKIIKHLLSCTTIGEQITIVMDCPLEKEASLLTSQGFLPHERYALMFKSVSESLPTGLSGENTWGILTEECG